MHFWVPKEYPQSAGKLRPLRHGAKGIILHFLLPIVTAVCFENFLRLPPAVGMMAGLTYLSFFFLPLQGARRTGSPQSRG
jgi:hypothetical protein